MEESVTYQAIIEEGERKGERKVELQGCRKTLLLLGEKRFGAPAPPAVVKSLEAIANFQKLEALSLRLLDATSWNELLGTPYRSSRRRKSP